MRGVRQVLWWLGTVGFSLASLQAVALVLFFTVGRLACKPVLESDGKAKHAMVLDIELHEPANDLDGLLGKPRQFVKPGVREGCYAEWTDEDPIMMLNNHGPKNGTELVFWKAFTLRGETTLGRYVGDLWTGVSVGSGGALSSTAVWSEVGNIGLIERMPPPQPAPPGFRAILPGECVFGSLDEGDERVVGRYWIELPGKRTVTIYPLGPVGPYAEMKVRLFYGDVEVMEHLEDEGLDLSLSMHSFGHFKIQKQGYHKITIVRVDRHSSVPPEKVLNKTYVLQVNWGKDLSSFCFRPEEVQHNCF